MCALSQWHLLLPLEIFVFTHIHERRRLLLLGARASASSRLTKPITIKVYRYSIPLSLIYNDKQEFIIFQCYDPHQHTAAAFLNAQRQTGCSVALAMLLLRFTCQIHRQRLITHIEALGGNRDDHQSRRVLNRADNILFDVKRHYSRKGAFFSSFARRSKEIFVDTKILVP